MKLKYIFTLLGVILLGLTSCGKKDAPKTESNNPFAGTQWERTYTATIGTGVSEVTTEEIHFVDDSHISYQASYKITSEDGTINKEGERNKTELTYVHKGAIATSNVTVAENEKVHHIKFTFTIDGSKQKLTLVASSEGEKDDIRIFTRKK